MYSGGDGGGGEDAPPDLHCDQQEPGGGEPAVCQECEGGRQRLYDYGRESKIVYTAHTVYIIFIMRRMNGHFDGMCHTRNK